MVKDSIGGDAFEDVAEIICRHVLKIIKQDLGDFGVEYDHWFSEKEMIKSAKINQVVTHLEDTNSLVKKDGATWLKTTNYGDDKDRVIIREDGRSTYFASDIGYHADKKARGFDKLINILGSDHHGYISRLKAGLASMGYKPGDLEVVLMQFVALYRGKEKIQMSTRSGNFVPMRDLYEEVGVDAARFFYVSRSHEQHLDFDLELAAQQNNQNPVYYIQYANARICSVLQEIKNKGFKNNPVLGTKNLDKLNNRHELELISLLQNYPDVINQAAEKRAVHQLSNYLKDLAQVFHSYYGVQKFVVADDETRNPMILLLQCVSIVIVDGLKILGVSAPKTM
jgi:arginyl-tRNA synthetase